MFSLSSVSSTLLQGYPSESDDDQMKDKWFSYTVSISRDKNSWLKLFDYSSFACWGTQNLPFPRQAARQELKLLVCACVCVLSIPCHSEIVYAGFDHSSVHHLRSLPLIFEYVLPIFTAGLLD